ncbi:MAG: CHAT domain-containing protein [Mojavia pulchra JT2-VF2]|jgi:CHAT domain-containing protein|uniref:CHAT domain-containing protein n=1 Tax=Mojavia pulchra JT2-VF2 TaxID=287848 RepID=A0A951UH65_9NOST|nr:CHAT domain-containing protein [Mojavia pulchra JT2-VF2]
MKPFVKLILVAALGLIFSLGLQFLPQVNAQQPVLAISKIQAQLNQLKLLLQNNQFAYAQTLLSRISELLKQLPTSCAAVYAHVNLTENIMNLHRQEEKGKVSQSCPRPELINIDNLDSSVAVVYPIILQGYLEVIVKFLGSDNIHCYTNKNVSVSQIDEAVINLRELMRTRSTLPKEIKTASQQFYDWLIKPFAAELETEKHRDKSQIKTLVFVLDGCLQNLPMSVLYDGQKYLVERYAIGVTPTLQLLSPKPLFKEKLNVLLAGASNAPSFAKERLAPLENVEVELLEVSKVVDSFKKLENENFLQENLQKWINSDTFNVVHIATHGKFSSNPEQTYILDWNKRIRVKDLDTLLKMKDLTRASSVELLVLSACETAIGDRRAVLGLAGVALRAGASSTLATLWQVNDASTTEFMIRFYQQLKKPKITKAEALRNTQLAFLKNYSDTDYNRPYHWGPFILVGNWL